MYSFFYLETVCCSMPNCCFSDQHTDFSRGRSGGLVFPSLEEFSRVSYSPHSQRLWQSQYNRNRYFLWKFLAFSMIRRMLPIWSLVPAFSKSSLNIWKFIVHVLLKPGLENFEHYFASVWDEWNCVVVWALFGIAFLWDWNGHWTFPVLWPLLSFPDLLAYWVQYFQSIIF